MQIEEGAIVSGKVTGLTDFGAFVELENGKTGMIHISEVAPTYVKDIREHLSVGQEVRTKVLSVSPEGKISLSIKKLSAEQAPSAPRPAQRPRQQRRSAPQVWNGPKSTAPPAGEKQSFEDMMARFKQVSDEKITDLKRSGDSKRGSPGYSRRSSNK